MLQNLLGLDEFQKKQKADLDALRLELQDALKKVQEEVSEEKKGLETFGTKLTDFSKKLRTELEALKKTPSETPSYATTKQVEAFKMALDNLESRFNVLRRTTETPKPAETTVDLKPVEDRLALLDAKFKQLSEEFERLAAKATVLESLNLLINRGYQEVAVCPNCQNKGHPISFVGQVCPTCRYSKLVKGLLVVGLQEKKK